MVSNRPRDAAMIEPRLSDGRGLLRDGGVSIGNAFSGDAVTRLLTVSHAALPGRSARGWAAFMASPFGFTRALAQEGARGGITVNVIAPGYIGTEMVRAIDEKVLKERIIPQIPVGRLGEPEEIARIVVFLASDDAGFITGSTISANGAQFFS